MRTTETSKVVSKLATQGHLIGDQWVASDAGGSYEHRYAATGEVQADVGLAGAADVDAAVAAARAAQPAWAALAPGERAVLPTGVSIALPDGYAAFVHPRSGLAARCGVSMLNAPGTIDAGYRGEIKVILINLDPRQSVKFARMDRIAQLVIQRVETVRFHEVDQLPGSARAEGGFGSTGGHAGSHNPYAAAVGSGVSADRAADRKGQ